MPSKRDVNLLDINLLPPTLELELWQQRDAPGGTSLRAYWHRASPAHSMQLSVTSYATTPLTLRLVVLGETQAWRADWVRWRPPVESPDDTGAGVSVRIQEEALLLTLPPGARYVHALDFEVWLDGESLAEDYGFDVVATDVQSGHSASIPGELRLRHPDARLLAYLPAIYTPEYEPVMGERYEDPPLFTRFLRGFEDALLPTQEILGQIETVFDPAIAPPDFLPWLASWVALTLDANWSELQRRRLIPDAVELYRWRGTRRGLTRYLEIYTGYAPEITDRPFQGMRLGNATRLGRNSIMGNTPPHTFVVTFIVPNRASINEQTVRYIIDAEKPAHTAYFLRVIEHSDA